jgi:hypothetical protein
VTLNNKKNKKLPENHGRTKNLVELKELKKQEEDF